MSSVTARINEIKQPRGGYIKPSAFITTSFNDGNILSEQENIHASIIGMAVDYLTRFMSGADLLDSFKISLLGVKAATSFGNKSTLKVAEKLLKGIKGLDNDSIINACKLVTFDVWYRNPMNAVMAKDYSATNPDKETINNIKIMVKRSLAFWDKYGPITVDGFTFETDGYTEIVNSGDGDYLTADTMWDFKVSKSKPTNKHTLQLLMYWIMGQHCGKAEYKKITKLGIFNPRLNIAYILEMETIPQNIIEDVEQNVICYK
ncbi:MAG: hypothetical protein OSJ61_07385 [Lachnospiraceae bacterium]|nr:hypothetical protein [Lachnospiraceae bacterium]